MLHVTKEFLADVTFVADKSDNKRPWRQAMRYALWAWPTDAHLGKAWVNCSDAV